jgi:DNA topoisomerase-1
LGNSRAICKKYYVHPGLIRLYEENNFSRYFNALNGTTDESENTELTSTERVLLKILKG